MGNLSNYESNEIGQARMGRLRSMGGKVVGLVNSMYAAAVEYNNYRVELDPVADADDIAYSDAAFVYTADQAKPVLDNLAPEEKAWLDAMLDALGYQPKPAE